VSPAEGDPGPGRLAGTVLWRASGDIWVDTEQGVLRCCLRGKMRQTENAVSGDRVRVTSTGPGTGVLEELLPRRSELRRGHLTGEPEGRVTAANLDQVAVVISARPAPPRWALVDRIQVEAQRGDLGCLVVVNKIDLAEEGAAERSQLEEAAEVYRAVGSQVFLISALREIGVDGLLEALRGRTTVLSGHSGVGKTTLLNRLVPDLGHRTGEVNPVTGKGRQTTSSVALVRLPCGGYIADTPGFREFAVVGLTPQDLGRQYPEFRDAVAACRFKDCLHQEEPGCALKAEVEAGRISKLRYQNYLQILRSLVEMGGDESRRKSARRRHRESS
jgi:ribosome biogenesis GTPase / thiamine phosphate phosphatase